MLSEYQTSNMGVLMDAPEALRFFRMFGVPYGSRTRVAAVKEKRPIVIQRNFAAWIALYRI